MQHCDEGTIHAWLDGALDADEQKLIERHVAECAECAALVVEARGLIAGASRIVRSLDVVPADVIPKRPPVPAKASRSVWRSLRFTPLRASLAATILIGVASTFAIRHERPRQASLAESAAVTSIQAPSSASPAPVPLASPAVASTAPRASGQAKSRAAEPKPQAQDSRAIVTPVEPAPAPVALVADADSLRRSKMNQLREAATALAARDSAMSARAEQTIRPAAAFASGARPVLVDAVTRESTTAQFFVGCYRVARDSTPTFVVFPERFALDRVGDTTAARNVVRAIGANGAMDSVVRTATWEADARNAVVVTWTTSSASQQLHLTALRNGQLNSAVSEGARVQPLPINRVICGR